MFDSDSGSGISLFPELPHMCHEFSAPKLSYESGMMLMKRRVLFGMWENIWFFTYISPKKNSTWAQLFSTFCFHSCNWNFYRFLDDSRKIVKSLILGTNFYIF